MEKYELTRTLIIRTHFESKNGQLSGSNGLNQASLHVFFTSDVEQKKDVVSLVRGGSLEAPFHFLK